MSLKSRTLAKINDDFRSVLGTDGSGTVIRSIGVDTYDFEDQARILNLVRIFNSFTKETDPSGEHLQGSFFYKTEEIVWEIEYHDPSLEFCSSDKTNVDVTLRVLTVKLANEL